MWAPPAMRARLRSISRSAIHHCRRWVCPQALTLGAERSSVAASSSAARAPLAPARRPILAATKGSVPLPHQQGMQVLHTSRAWSHPQIGARQASATAHGHLLRRHVTTSQQVPAVIICAQLR